MQFRLKLARALGVGFLCLGATGCAQLVSSIGKGVSKQDDDQGDQSAKTWPVPAACKGYSWDPSRKEDQIMSRVCDAHAQNMVSLSVEKAHRTFDDREPDVLVAASNVIDCAESCGERTPIAKVVTGYYATLYSRDALSDALDGLSLDPEVRRVFIDKAMASVRTVELMASDIGPRRKRMYFDTFWDVVEARQAYFEKHAAAYAELDAARAEAKKARAGGKAPATLLTKIADLRANYLAQCDDDLCRYDPFVITATRELVLLHITADDHLQAKAENALLQEKAAGRHLFSVETGTAIYRAMEEERHQHGAYKKAKQSGVDDATLEARFGSPPPLPVDPVRGLIGANQLPDMTAILDGGPKLRAVGGTVATVKPDKKGMARVTFVPRISKRPVRRCYRTGRVVAVRWQGNRGVLEYERKCHTVGEKTDVKQKEPVLVPASEVADVAPGEILEALVDETRQGLVIRSSAVADEDSEATNRILQVRGSRLGGA